MRGLCTAWAACVLAGCVYSGELLVRDASTEPPDGGTSATMPWGRYAATLAIPPCPASASASLVVDTTDDFLLDGGAALTEAGGQRLSFRQALYIAANRPGLDRIEFDQTVFPADAPTTLALTGFTTPLTVGAVCIDARDRGVVVRFEDTGSNMWRLEPGSMQVGLTILNAPNRQFVTDSRIAACRFGTDGERTYPSSSAWTVQAAGASYIGPGNVFAGRTAIRVFDGPFATITENSFGVDPLTGVVLPLREGVEVSPQTRPLGLIIARNVFGTIHAATVFDLPGYFRLDAGSIGTFTDNLVGVNLDGGPLPGGTFGVGYVTAGRLVVGPGNVVRHATLGVRIGDEAEVLVTQNSISRCVVGIEVGATPKVLPPTLTAVTATHVSGRCDTEGRVEVFADPAANGARFLGATLCTVGQGWTVAVSAAAGENVTATLTSVDAVTRQPTNTSAFSAPSVVP